MTEDRTSPDIGASIALFRALIEHAWDAISLVSADAVHRYLSPATHRILGYTPVELVGRNVFDLVHPDDRSLAESVFGELLLTPRTSMTVQIRHRHKDGSWKWLECIGTNLLAEPSVQAVVANFRDITERRRVEEALRQSTQLNAQIISSVHEGIVVYDAELRCLLLNPYLEEATGLRTDEVLGKHPWDVFPFLRNVGLEAMLGRALAGETVIGPDLRYEMPRTGSSGWHSARFSPLRNPAGHIIGVIGTIRDITHSKQEEERRRQLEVQMQHAQKRESLGVLAAGLAHDFNNLLTIVLGNTALVRQELPAGAPLQLLLNDIQTAADAAAALTRQMLAYGGKAPGTVQLVSLSHIVREMAALLHSVISKKAVVRFDLATELPAIEADPTQIRQIVMNLITNASDALGGACGTITLRTSVAARGAANSLPARLAAGTYVSLEVIDTGSGMDEATRAKIFDPFFSTKFTGRGLGMSAVLGIVQAHRGSIEIASELGRGTTVRVLLPAPEPVPAESGDDAEF